MGDRERDQHVQNQGTKIKDILKSIRGIIENHDLAKEESSVNDHQSTSSERQAPEEEEVVLELIETVDPDKPDEKEEQMLSDGMRSGLLTKIERFIDKVESNNHYPMAAPSIDEAALNIMKPLIREWLDNNLPKLVEKIMSEELKQLVPKKH